MKMAKKPILKNCVRINFSKYAYENTKDNEESKAGYGPSRVVKTNAITSFNERLCLDCRSAINGARLGESLIQSSPIRQLRVLGSGFLQLTSEILVMSCSQKGRFAGLLSLFSSLVQGAKEKRPVIVPRSGNNLLLKRCQNYCNYPKALYKPSISVRKYCSCFCIFSFSAQNTGM